MNRSAPIFQPSPRQLGEDLPPLESLMDAAISRASARLHQRDSDRRQPRDNGSRQPTHRGWDLFRRRDRRRAAGRMWRLESPRQALSVAIILEPGRDSAFLDPARDAARVRAMYTHPDFARQGVGRLILSLCEAAAAAEGSPCSFELAATHCQDCRSTRRLRLSADRAVPGRGAAGAAVPLVRMGETARDDFLFDP